MYRVIYSIEKESGYATECNEENMAYDLMYYGEKGYVVMFTEDLKKLQEAFNLKSINDATNS